MIMLVKFKDEIEKKSIVSEVTISGWDETEFRINIDPKKLEAYGFTLSNVNSIIAATNITFPIWGNYNLKI